MGDHEPDGRARLTDTQAPGWRHPREHLARRVEVRTPAEMMNLLALDALIATYGMDADELRELMLQVRSLYRGGGSDPTTGPLPP